MDFILSVLLMFSYYHHHLFLIMGIDGYVNHSYSDLMKKQLLSFFPMLAEDTDEVGASSCRPEHRVSHYFQIMCLEPQWRGAGKLLPGRVVGKAGNVALRGEKSACCKAGLRYLYWGNCLCLTAVFMETELERHLYIKKHLY